MGSREAEHNLAVMRRGALLSGLVGGLTSNYSYLFMRELGGSYLAIGGLSLLTTFISSFIGLAGGFVADAIGKRNLILFFNFIGIITSFIIIFVRDWQTLFIVSVIGTISALSGPATTAMRDEATPKKGTTTSLAVTQSIEMFPNIIMPVLGGLMLTWLGVGFGYRVSTALGTLVAIVAFFNNLSLIETGKSASSSKIQEPKQKVEFSTPVKANMASWAMIMFANSIVNPFYIIFATEIVGLKPLEWGVILSAQTVVAILFKIPGGVIADKMGKKKLMMITVFLNAAIPSMFALFSKNFNDAFFYQMLLVTVGMFYGQAAYAMFILQTPDNTRSQSVAVWTSVTSWSRLPGSLIGGFLFGINPVFPFLLFTAVEWASVYVMMWTEDEKKEG